MKMLVLSKTPTIRYIVILTNPPGIPGLSREIQGFYPEPRDFLAKSRDFESIYVVIDILLNAIEAKCMNNLLKKSFKYRITSNSRPPSNNRLPRIIAPPKGV